MAKNKTKLSPKKIVVIVVAVLLVLAIIAAGAALIFKGKDKVITIDKNNQEISPSYSIGAIDSTGRYKNSTDSIYTANAFECLGLNIKTSFQLTVSYQVFFYDENEEFISASEILDKNYNTVPGLAKYARVVITPNKLTEITKKDIKTLSNQITITVSKNQNFELKNYFEVDKNYVGVYVPTTSTKFSESSENSVVGQSKLVSVKEYKTLRLGVPNMTGCENAVVLFVGADKDTIVSFERFSLNTEDEIQYFECAIPENVSYCSVTYAVVGVSEYVLNLY